MALFISQTRQREGTRAAENKRMIGQEDVSRPNRANGRKFLNGLSPPRREGGGEIIERLLQLAIFKRVGVGTADDGALSAIFHVCVQLRVRNPNLIAVVWFHPPNVG